MWIAIILVFVIMTILAFSKSKQNDEVVMVPSESGGGIKNTGKEIEIPIEDIWNKIPNDVKELLYLSDKDPGHIEYNTIVVGTLNQSNNGSWEKEKNDEPSTIYKKAIIAIPANGEIVPDLGYYPSYLRMYPVQKWKYLSWLKNIDLPIEPGYVFLFYYGLERQLFQGNFDLAFSTIIRIRKNFSNNSLLTYSRKALVYSAIIKERYDRFLELKFLLNDKKWGNEHILIKYWSNEDLDSNEIMKIVLGLKDKNTRYIINEPDHYKRELDNILFLKYGKYTFPLKEIVPSNKIVYRTELVFSNISFPESNRSFPVPVIDETDLFINAISDLHVQSHDKVKMAKRKKE